MINEIFLDSKFKMNKTIDHFSHEVTLIRTGRATSSLLENIKVDYFGTSVPLKNIAHITVPEPQSLLVQAFDPNSLDMIEKAIVKSEVGLTPNNDGSIIRVNVPVLTEERRKELIKYVQKIAEENRVSIRNIRRYVNDQLKNLEKKHVSEDEIKRGLHNIQELTNQFIDQINSIVDRKEKEILL